MLELMPLFLGVFLAQASPGPNLMAVSAQALAQGRGAGVLVAAGVATGVFVWAIVFAFGMGALLVAVPETLVAMKLLGGGYLMYLGLRALRSARRGGAGPMPQAKAARRAYLTGLLVVLTNPKAMLMWVAVSAYLTSLQVGALGTLGVGLGVAASAFAIYGTYAALFSTGHARALYGRFFRGVEAGFGAVFGLIGARLVFDGVRSLRG